MATKQEYLKAFLNGYVQLKKIYGENPEFRKDETEEDKALYIKAEYLYTKMQLKKNNSTSATEIVTPGNKWEGSPEANTLNELQSLPSYSRILQGFSTSQNFEVVFNIVNQEEMANYLLQQWVKLQPTDMPIDEGQIANKKEYYERNSKTKMGFTVFDFANIDGQVVLAGETAEININSELENLRGQPVKLSDLGRALTIIHETVHARYLIDKYEEFSEYSRESKQHANMAKDHRTEIQGAIREYANFKNITLATTPIDEAELLSHHGLAIPRQYIIDYAAKIYNETITDTEDNKNRMQEVYEEILKRIDLLTSMVR